MINSRRGFGSLSLFEFAFRQCAASILAQRLAGTARGLRRGLARVEKVGEADWDAPKMLGTSGED